MIHLEPKAIGLRSGMTIAYVPGVGNLGDAVIAWGTLSWFTRYGISAVQWNRTEKPDAVVATGGGCLIERYQDLRNMLPTVARRFPDVPVLLLPNTVSGEKSLGMLSKLENLTLVACREETSCQNVRAAGLPAVAAHDMAFEIDLTGFPATGRAGTLVAWRKDSEARGAQPESGDHCEDISERQNGAWPLESAPGAAWGFAQAINKFERVVTNRLHVAIVAARLGLTVELHPNDYYKNEAVWRYSLAGMSNVSFKNLRG